MDFLRPKIRSENLIKIQAYSPPPHYEEMVRRKGLQYLTRNPRPSSADFSRHAYWSEIHNELYSLHSGICAYSASWTPRVRNAFSHNTSIDHFIPKTLEPHLAYEWENFRLCRARLNANKGDRLDVMDPLYIRDGWFTVDFLTFLMRPLATAPDFVKTHVTSTIDCLRLNDNEYVEERIEVIRGYSCDQIPIDWLRMRYPFLANEILRQDFDTHFKEQMRSFFLDPR